eukprot:gene17339-15896_t
MPQPAVEDLCPRPYKSTYWETGNAAALKEYLISGPPDRRPEVAWQWLRALQGGRQPMAYRWSCR